MTFLVLPPLDCLIFPIFDVPCISDEVEKMMILSTRPLCSPKVVEEKGTKVSTYVSELMSKLEKVDAREIFCKQLSASKLSRL